MVKRSQTGQQSQPTITSQNRDNYGKNSDIEYQYHNLQQLVREELDQVRKVYSPNPYGGRNPNEAMPQKSTTQDKSGSNDYTVQNNANLLIDDKNMFSKRFSEQVDNKKITLSHQEP